MTLTDVFRNTPWRVALEKELALQSQLLDVVIIEQAQRSNLVEAPDLPDGLGNLRAHNLLTYKSQHEALDGRALDELMGHYVNYRKLLSPEKGLLPESTFQLYAVATRHPQGLAKRQSLKLIAWPGVYDVIWGTQTIRLIVLNTITQHPRNAPWELFSLQQDRIRHGAQNYRQQRLATWELLHQLYLTYTLWRIRSWLIRWKSLSAKLVGICCTP